MNLSELLKEIEIKQVDENKFIVNGLFRLEEFYQYFNIDKKPDDDVETIGGLIQKRLCRLAKINDEVYMDNLKLKVVELKERRIKKVLVSIVI